MALGPARLLAVFAAFGVLALGVYFPALGGPFISDDAGYVLNNPYIHELSFESVTLLFDPFGPPAAYSANYAPLHLLAHALEWRAFGAETAGYHLVNVVLHAVAAALLVAVFASSGIPRTAAVVLGSIFLLHPANVEAVAWIFQLKTILALVLSLGALLALERRPLLALVLFALGLLAKISAAYALPVAALLLWVRGEQKPARWAWLGAWTLLLALVAAPEFVAFRQAGQVDASLRFGDPGAHARSIVAIAGRYLVMGLTSFGVSAFQEPAPSSLGDPWWLGGLLTLAALAWRWVVVLRRREEEAAYWAWAVASFAPVSQIFPFPYPVADRYLYFILPGLLGGFFFMARDAWARGRRVGLPGLAALPRVALGAGVIVAALFGWHSAARAPLWRSEAVLTAEAALNYPDGTAAAYLAARRAAQSDDVPGALAALHRMADRGYDGFLAVQGDPALAPLLGEPGVDEVVARLADNWIRAAGPPEALVQPELRMLALAHLARGDREAALAALDRALEKGGPLDASIRAERTAVRSMTAP